MHIIRIPNRPELSLEFLFSDDVNVACHDGESVALYVSGCPALHLFELIVVSMHLEDQSDMLKQLWNVLYVDEWSSENAFKIIISGESRLHLYKLYSDEMFDSIKMIRHRCRYEGTGGY